nr:hypothetical protein GCM10020093_113920 [Planobispora longispora]
MAVQRPAPAALAAAQPVYDHMRTELMCGQYLDLLEQAHGENTFESALRVALFKSGKYSVEHPLRLGLVLAAQGREPWIDRLCEGYGRSVGIAFQLRDDILGVFGDPAETGKPAGDDLREGKRTMLIARTLAAASPRRRSRCAAPSATRTSTRPGSTGCAASSGRPGPSTPARR